MIYEIKKISDTSDLNQCHSFEISHFQWRSVYHPRAFGRIGYIQDKGFLVYLSCEEVNPKADFFHNFDPVYKDSALEAFFQFDPDCGDYFNFEFNANGACIAAYGASRHLRTQFNAEQILDLNIRPKITSHGWQILFLIPESAIFFFQPKARWKQTHRIFCNFYKLSESPEIEHYGSFAPVPLPQPNFHRTDFFVQARIV